MQPMTRCLVYGSMVLSSEQREELTKIFMDYDEDGSGCIDRDELERIAQDLGEPLSAEELEILIQQLDEDNSGQIDFEEFISWWEADE